MEYCSGGTLFKFLQQNPNLDVLKAKSIFKQILMGLDFLHNNLIAHRDINLDNILICGKNGEKVKIIDFGEAKICKTSEDDHFKGDIKELGPILYLLLNPGSKDFETLIEFI